AALPDYDARHVPEMVERMASELGLRRRQARLRVALREQSEAFQRERQAQGDLLEVAVRITKEGALPDHAANEAALVASDFASTTVDRARSAVRTGNRSGQRLDTETDASADPTGKE